MPDKFVAIPNTTNFRFANGRVPSDLLTPPRDLPSSSSLIDIDIDIRDGRIARISAAGETPSAEPVVDLAQSLVLPRFVDPHTHIDKGHIFARSPNPNGTHKAARETVGADRERHWRADDVEARMTFALQCAFAHGSGALRTHIDSIGKQTGISWPVFDRVRQDWHGRISLQAVALFPTLFAVDDEAQFKFIVATAARYGGLLGGLTFVGDAPDAKLELALERTFAAASAHGLDLDFHSDESDSPNARTLETVADVALKMKFRGRITAGHCCRLALDDDAYRARVINKIGEARINVISLPMCNMYLQDRGPMRTPRWRGITPLHELDTAGITVAVASDNTRDPFYAYGDLDMLEVFREATRIAHFDHKATHWTRLLAAAPATIMGLDHAGRIAEGHAANLVITRARTLNELLSRPQSDRIVLVNGVAIDTTLPDYRKLDTLTD